MLRGSEVAPKVVVLELARDQEEGVERDAEERSAISPPVSHLIDDITGYHRPMMSLNRAETPPRSDSPTSLEMPCCPRIPVTWDSSMSALIPT